MGSHEDCIMHKSRVCLMNILYVDVYAQNVCQTWLLSVGLLACMITGSISVRNRLYIIYIISIYNQCLRYIIFGPAPFLPHKFSLIFPLSKLLNLFLPWFSRYLTLIIHFSLSASISIALLQSMKSIFVEQSHIQNRNSRIQTHYSFETESVISFLPIFGYILSSAQD